MSHSIGSSKIVLNLEIKSSLFGPMVLYIGGQFLLQYKISHLGLMVFVSPTA
jgi:hypothetical protein